MLSNTEKQKIATILSELNDISVPESNPIFEVVLNFKTKLTDFNNRVEDLSPDEISDLLTNLNQVLLEAEKLNSDNIEVFQILDQLTPKKLDHFISSNSVAANSCCASTSSMVS